jgi:hypothetical protein
MLCRADLLVQNAMISGLAGTGAACGIFLVDGAARDLLLFGIAADLPEALVGLAFFTLIVAPAVCLISGLVVIVYGAPAAFLLEELGLDDAVLHLAAGGAGGLLVAILFGWAALDARACCIADGCAAAWAYRRCRALAA